MQIKSFQDLHVWQKGHLLVLDIYKITKSYPKDELYGLVSQLRRSSSSVCANISEGHRKGTKEFARFLSISQASLEETKYHLILSKDLAYISVLEYKNLSSRADELSKMLYSLRKKLLFKLQY